MKHLLSILLISSICLTQELEVDGNLKVTGTVESATIDSLKAVIAELQAQLAALQGAGVLQTRVYELPRFNFNGVTTMEFVDLSEITGYDLDYAILDIIYVTDSETNRDWTNNNLRIPNGTTGSVAIGISIAIDGGVRYDDTYENITYVGGEILFQQTDNGTSPNHIGYADIILSATAQFPE